MHDIGVIGLGAMGLASAWAASRAGARIIGFDQFPQNHRQGSSHGETRMIRGLYSEGRVYMPLLDRGYALWGMLEADAGETLLEARGGLDIAAEGSALLREVQACADMYDRPCILMDAMTVNECWPALNLPDTCAAIMSRESGVLLSDRANMAMARLAQDNGADLNWETPVLSVTPDTDGFVIRTHKGDSRVRRVINAAGPWADRFYPGLQNVLTVERQVVGYFDGPDGDVPPFQRELDDGRRVYLLPAAEPGRWKLGLYHHRRQRGPSHCGSSEVDAEDRRILTGCLKAVLPDCPPPDRFEVCRFTNTEDGRFVIDHAADLPDMVLVAACSGHGYKFAPAVGEAAVALALDLPPPVDLSPFTLARQTKL
ncbi:N-methyl-L-tryptophan oxidase [Hyphobacterium sp. CCMP332]|uniref:N-methyl-L-tryptophan oxidase n=1 Tax=Hyphobacterium sp. CCMP332 TaxID=2749086 RepID=UPI00164EDD2B|nr:N-methyl-L-tryptophan oxidase [Hyphobacterium sp. CCMP332]QNL20143.1 N-methyl-L-tryptophan oxidase [Hyphobacterium sp. CCMP332]